MSNETKRTDGHNSTDSLDTSSLFHILSNERRRITLDILSRGPMDLGELATQVTARENGIPPAEVTSDMRKCVYVGLYQAHLPKLKDHGVIEETETGELCLTDKADTLLSYMDYEPENTNPQSGIVSRVKYVGTAILS